MVFALGMGGLLGQTVPNARVPANFGWTTAFICVIFAGIALYILRERKRNKENPSGKSMHEKLDDLPSVIADAIEVRRQQGLLEVVKNDEAPVPMGDTFRIPAGASVSSAIGAGPLTFTVPSGGIFGTSPTGEVHFTLPEGQTIVLPDGGTVAPQLSGKVNALMTAEGRLTTGSQPGEMPTP